MKNIFYFVLLLLIVSCDTSSDPVVLKHEEPMQELAKFEEAECLLFVGQDLASIGGTANYEEGYCNYFSIPDGVTTYTGMSDLAGLDNFADWGAGPVCAKTLLDAPNLNQCSIAIGLSLVGQIAAINSGELDHSVIKLGNWFKKHSTRKFFLRIGYEFDGTDWNHYEKISYVFAWKRIVTQFRSMGVKNVAYVWQSKGYGSSLAELETWYPGDGYVDWCAYSYFSQHDENMIVFARQHNKPVFIAEATPIDFKNEVFHPVSLSDEQRCREIWIDWYEPLFETIEQNADVVKALSYINCNWTKQSMWKWNPMFKNIDSRLQSNDWISQQWLSKITDVPFVKNNE